MKVIKKVIDKLIGERIDRTGQENRIQFVFVVGCGTADANFYSDNFRKSI